MKVTDNSTFRLMQTNLNRITTDLLELRKQGSTGLKFNTASDDPGSVRPVLTARTQIQEGERYIDTLGKAGDDMDSTDSHLGHVEDLLVRAKEIAINAVNSSLSQSDLNTLADEISELRAELLDSANAVVDGKYIFAGYQEKNVPFVENESYDASTYDISNVTTWPYLYQGDPYPTELEIASNEYLEVNLTGNELFMGITNEIALDGYANPFQGQSVTSGDLAEGTGDITITPDGGATVTITAADMTDTDDNYAGKLAALFNLSGTDLVSTTNAATVDLGALSLTGFDESASDSYDLNITSGGSTVSVSLTGSTGYDFTLEGLASALANSLPQPDDLTSTSGTLPNGVSYDISSGSLELTGPDNGSEIEVSETIAGAAASGGIGGDQTVFGTINIATNSSTDVYIDGAGLGDLGLSTTNLDGASGSIDIFTVLMQTEEAIRAGNVTDGSIETQIDQLEIAADQNRTYRSTLGNRATRVESASYNREQSLIDLQATLSRYQDADILEVYNDIIQKESAFEAALSVTGRISQISILDYF
ncbi:MAG: flagellar hook-associated protein 3 [Desulforhopalus sp.]|jgi:flagellar hook-associated protein 3